MLKSRWKLQPPHAEEFEGRLSKLPFIGEMWGLHLVKEFLGLCVAIFAGVF